MYAAMARGLIEFLREEDGPTAVEYAVILALIILVCFGSITVIGGKTNQHFNNLSLQGTLSGSS